MKKLFYLNEDKPNKLIKYVVLIGFLVALFSIFIKQPMSWYDEETHYIRVLNLLNGDFKVVKDNDMSQVGGRISETETIFVDRAFNSKISGSSVPAVDNDWFSDYSDLSYSSKQVFRATTNTIPNSPITYFPYIVAGFIGKLLKLSPAISFFLMRVFGLITYFLIYILAIKKASRGSLSLSLFLLSPPVLLSFSSVTADAYLIAISALYFVTIIEFYKKMFSQEGINSRDILELSITSLLFVFTKMPNFIFIGLLLPIIWVGVRQKLLQKKNVLQLLAILIFCALITVVWYFIVGDVNTGLFWGRNVDTGSQLKYILSKPIDFIRMIAYAILNFNYLDLQTAYNNLNVYGIPLIISIFYYVGIFLSSKVNPKNHSKLKFDSFFLVSSILAVISFVALVFIMLYLQFSEIGSPIIEGVQARYFIPIWLFIIVMISNTWNKTLNKGLNFIFGLGILPMMILLLYFITGFLNGIQ